MSAQNSSRLESLAVRSGAYRQRRGGGGGGGGGDPSDEASELKMMMGSGSGVTQKMHNALQRRGWGLSAGREEGWGEVSKEWEHGAFERSSRPQMN